MSVAPQRISSELRLRTSTNSVGADSKTDQESVSFIVSNGKQKSVVKCLKSQRVIDALGAFVCHIACYSVSVQGRNVSFDDTIEQTRIKTMQELHLGIPLLGGADNPFSKVESELTSFEHSTASPGAGRPDLVQSRCTSLRLAKSTSLPDTAESAEQRELRTRLSKTAFFAQLSRASKSKLVNIFTHEQLLRINQFDASKGYTEIANTDVEQAESDLIWVYKALNEAFDEKRIGLFAQLKKSIEKHSNEAERSQWQEALKNIKTKFKKFQPPAAQQNQPVSNNASASSVPASRKKVACATTATYKFDYKNQADRKFVELLLRLGLGNELTLPPFLHLNPIIQLLDENQCCEALKIVLEDEGPVGLASYFLKAWVSGQTQEKERKLSELLRLTLLRHHISAWSDGQEQQMIQLIYDGIPNHLSAKNVVKKALESLSEDKNSVAEKFFQSLEMDSKVNLLSQFEANDESNVFRDLQASAVHHHRYFHLNGESKPSGEAKDKLAEMHLHVDKLQRDMQQSWQQVPFDMPGDFLQSLPKPAVLKDGKMVRSNEFICVQPFSQNNQKSINEVHATLNAGSSRTSQSSKKKSPWKGIINYDCNVQHGEREIKHYNQFSIISFWSYCAERRKFECRHSFESVPLIGFEDGSIKHYRKQYLFVGRNNEVFYFCNKIVESSSQDQDSLTLCVIKEDANFQNGRQQKNNIKVEYEIPEGSELHDFILPKNKSRGVKETRFHLVPPTLITTEALGRVCVFSYARPERQYSAEEEKEPKQQKPKWQEPKWPSLYFHGLAQKATVRSILGCEVFIDYIHECDGPKEKGTLYYLTDSEFFKAVRVAKKEVLSKRNSKPSIMRIEDFCLGDDHLNPVYSKISHQKLIEEKIKLVNNSEGQLLTVDSLEESLSRNQVWVMAAIPMLKDTESKNLVQFCIISMDHITKSSAVFIFNIGYSDEHLAGELSFHQQLSEQDQHRCYLQIEPADTAESDGKIIISTLHKNEDQIKLSFHSSPEDEIKRADFASQLEWKASLAQQTYRLVHQKAKQILVPYGEEFICQQPLLLNSDVIGCFLDKNQYAVHWYHEKVTSPKVGRNYQSHSTTPTVIIEYPMIAYNGPFPDFSELTLVNLADQQSARMALKLKNLKFEHFVHHRNQSDQTRICFLARRFELADDGAHYEQKMAHCIINCSRMFQKKVRGDMSHYSLEIQDLGTKADAIQFQKLLPTIVKIESVHDMTLTSSQCYVIQYERSIYIYTHCLSRSEWLEVSSPKRMKKVTMQRGFQNTFYFVEKDASDYADSIVELKIVFDRNRFLHFKRPVFELPSGQVLTLEVDQLHVVESMMSERAPALQKNRVLFIDDSLVFYELKEEGEEDQYNEVSRQNLADSPAIVNSLQSLKREPFALIQLSSKCITIKGKIINLKDMSEQDFQYLGGSGQEKAKWKILKEKNIDQSHRLLQIAEKKTSQGDIEYSFIVKPQPSSRKISLFGNKAIGNVESIEFVSDKRFLVKFKGGYWSMMDTTGQILKVPRQLEQALQMSQVEMVATQRLYENGSVLLLVSNETEFQTMQIDYKSKVCALNQFTKSESARQSKSRQLLADENNRVFVVQQSILKLPGDSQVSSREEQSETGFSISLLTSKQSPSTHKLSIISVTDESIQEFVVCGDYLCWLKVTDVDKGNFCRQIYFALITEIPDSIQSQDIFAHQFLDLVPYMQYPETCELSISAAPISTHLSQRSQREYDHSSCESVNRSLLQVTIQKRAIVFDLTKKNQTKKRVKKASADKLPIRDFSDMHQLLKPEDYVASEVNIQQNKMENLKQNLQKVVYLATTEIVSNKAKDFFYLQKKRTCRNQQSQNQTLEIENEKTRDLASIFLGAFKTYSELDVVGLRHIYQLLRHRKHSSTFDIECLLSIYQGESVFSIKQLDSLYALIEDRLKEMDFKVSMDDSELQHSVLKRLFQVLMTPQPWLFSKKASSSEESTKKKKKKQEGQISRDPDSDEKRAAKEKQKGEDQKKGMYSVLEMIPYSGNQGASKKLLAIANNCSQQSIIVFSDTQDDVERLLEHSASLVNTIFGNTFTESIATRKITSVEWPEGQTFIAFEHPSCLINEEECTRKIQKQHREKQKIFNFFPRPFQEFEECHQNSVKVRLLDIGWLFADNKDFLHFVHVLNSCSNKELYMTDFVKALLEVYWDSHKRSIALKVFLPYTIYLSTTLVFIFYAVTGEADEEQIWPIVLGKLLIASIFYQLMVEVIQLRSKDNLIEHFMDIVNICDMGQYLMNLVLVVVTVYKLDFIEEDTRKIMSALVGMLLWLKMFDWMRMFDTTSFYIKLIKQTFSDILPFFFIFPIFLASFGTPIYILSKSRAQGEPVMAEITGNGILDVIFNQYLLSLGEFETFTENFEGQFSILILVLFNLASFCTMVTALNMIIAIMSDTFTKVNENREQHQREMKLSLLSDYTSMIRERCAAVKQKDSFLVIVTPLEADGSAQQQDWEGTVKAVRNSLNKMQTKMSDDLDYKLSQVKGLIMEQKLQRSALDREAMKQNIELKLGQQRMMEKFTQMMQAVAEIKTANEDHSGQLNELMRETSKIKESMQDPLSKEF